ncbi:unnamed protein product, partial [Gulo gulo]
FLSYATHAAQENFYNSSPLVLTINICNYCDTSEKGDSRKEKEKRNGRRNHDFKFSLNPHKVIFTNSHLTKHL